MQGWNELLAQSTLICLLLSMMAVPDCSCCSELAPRAFDWILWSRVSPPYQSHFTSAPFLFSWKFVLRKFEYVTNNAVLLDIALKSPHSSILLPPFQDRRKNEKLYKNDSLFPICLEALSTCIVSLSRFYSLLTMMERRISRFHDEQAKENPTKLNALGVFSLSWINIFWEGWRSRVTLRVPFWQGETEICLMFISMSCSCLPKKFRTKGEIVFQKLWTSESQERQQGASNNGFIGATPESSKSKPQGGQSAAQKPCLFLSY